MFSGRQERLQVESFEHVLITNYKKEKKEVVAPQQPYGGGGGWGGGWGKRSYEGTVENDEKRRRHKKELDENTPWDGTSPSPTDWGFKLSIIKLARKQGGSREGWGERENRYVLCPIGHNCRYRGSTCSLEHRPERRAVEVADVMKAGRTPLEMGRDLTRVVEKKMRE